MLLKEILLALRKNKIFYYTKGYILKTIPTRYFGKRLFKKLLNRGGFDAAYISERIDYYNKLDQVITTPPDFLPIKNIGLIKAPKAYFIDSYEYLRYFSKELKASFTFGDVVTTSQVPTIQKARPINHFNKNAILLNLDKKRHFFFIKDHKAYSEKQSLLFGRGVITQPHRMRFMERYYNHPLCNLGQVNSEGGNKAWLKPKVSILAHLDYKFILSLEGNDVATNLKWIMSSNSIAVMTKPKHESWFMEGRLIPDFHYILIKDDYSDLIEKLDYYIANTEKAENIVRNANQHVKQFFNADQEGLIAFMVLKKYFYYTSQVV